MYKNVRLSPTAIVTEFTVIEALEVVELMTTNVTPAAAPFAKAPQAKVVPEVVVTTMTIAEFQLALEQTVSVTLAYEEAIEVTPEIAEAVTDEAFREPPVITAAPSVTEIAFKVPPAITAVPSVTRLVAGMHPTIGETVLTTPVDVVAATFSPFEEIATPVYAYVLVLGTRDHDCPLFVDAYIPPALETDTTLVPSDDTAIPVQFAAGALVTDQFTPVFVDT